jgi:hypothetical protein
MSSRGEEHRMSKCTSMMRLRLSVIQRIPRRSPLPICLLLSIFRQATRVDDAKKAFEWPAATLNPAKLCYAVHRLALSKGGYSMYTHTPALSVTESDSKGSWNVNTSRGTIRAKKVVHTTNAYASALLPELSGLVTPTKGKRDRVLGMIPQSINSYFLHKRSNSLSLPQD